MTNSSAAKLLSPEEIAHLNRDGARLSENKFYAQFFLINDRPNNAADPFPFQIAPESLEKIARTAVGRPFVIGATGAKHVRGPKGIFASARDIIEYQKQFAAGEIVHEYINPSTGNANVIFEIFPEYVDHVKNGRIPPYVSPLVENVSKGIEVKNGRMIIRDGRILHLQAVDRPGYGEIATLHGTCEGMLNECMSELRTLGASGRLQEYQKKIGNFDYMAIHQRIARSGERGGRVLGASSFTPSIRAALKKTRREEENEKVDYLALHERIGKRRL